MQIVWASSGPVSEFNILFEEILSLPFLIFQQQFRFTSGFWFFEFPTETFIKQKATELFIFWEFL